jgi:hypothetical protein
MVSYHLIGYLTFISSGAMFRQRAPMGLCTVQALMGTVFRCSCGSRINSCPKKWKPAYLTARWNRRTPRKASFTCTHEQHPTHKIREQSRWTCLQARSYKVLGKCPGYEWNRVCWRNSLSVQNSCICGVMFRQRVPMGAGFSLRFDGGHFQIQQGAFSNYVR